MRARLARELGYQSAKVGADAAIFDDDGRILLVHRSDDLRWGLIAGWVDPGETPPDTVVREVLEEADLEVTAFELSTWSGGRRATRVRTPRRRSRSCTSARSRPGRSRSRTRPIAAGYHHPEDVDDWHANHEQLALLAREHWRARRA